MGNPNQTKIIDVDRFSGAIDHGDEAQIQSEDEMLANVERLDKYRKAPSFIGALDDLLAKLNSDSLIRRNSAASSTIENEQNRLASALALLSKASSTLELMEKRNKDVEDWAEQKLRASKAENEGYAARVQAFEDRAKLTEQVIREYGNRAAAAEERALVAEQRTDRAEAMLKEAESRAADVEARAARAEAEARDAERWLTHISELISNNLSSASDIFSKLNAARDPVSELEKRLGKQ